MHEKHHSHAAERRDGRGDGRTSHPAGPHQGAAGAAQQRPGEERKDEDQVELLNGVAQDEAERGRRSQDADHQEGQTARRRDAVGLIRLHVEARRPARGFGGVGRDGV